MIESHPAKFRSEPKARRSTAWHAEGELPRMCHPDQRARKVDETGSVLLHSSEGHGTVGRQYRSAVADIEILN